MKRIAPFFFVLFALGYPVCIQAQQDDGVTHTISDHEIHSAADFKKIYLSLNRTEKRALIHKFLAQPSKAILENFSTIIENDEILEQKLKDAPIVENLSGEFYFRIQRNRAITQRKTYYQKTNSPRIQEELEALFGSDYQNAWPIAICDSILIALEKTAFEHPKISAKTLDAILHLNGYRSPSYEAIRVKAIQFETEDMLAGLAAYKNPADVPFLKSKQDKSIRAIGIYPHAALQELLTRYFENRYHQYDFQKAVTSYRNTVSAQLATRLAHKIIQSKLEKSEKEAQLFKFYDILEATNYKGFAPAMNTIQRYWSKK